MHTDFADLYRTHFPRITLQLHAYLGSHAEAQDVTQEAFCRALDRWHRISRYDDPSAWVRRVAWNLATSQLRRYQTSLRYLARQRVEPVAGPEPDRLALTAALATLPTKHRTAVVQHHLGRLSTAEIAEQEGVAEGTVRSWLSRGRGELAEHFREFESASAATTRPPGAEAAAATVRRRKRAKLAAVAAAVIALLVISAAVFGINRENTPPPAGTTPSPSPTPFDLLAVPVFPVTPPEPDLEVAEVSMVSATAGWALFTKCNDPSAERTVCQYALSKTEDAGRTWHQAALPELPGENDIIMYPLDADTAVLYVRQRQEAADPLRSFLITRDGGQTFQSYDYYDAPREARLVGPTGRAAGPVEYRVMCPGMVGYEDGAFSFTCDQEELIHVDSGVISPRPPLLEQGHWCPPHHGGDGRVWLVCDGGAAAVSADGARTWRTVPNVPGEFLLSPDGLGIWAYDRASERLYQLKDEGWHVELDSLAVKHIAAFNDSDLIVIESDGSAYYLYPYGDGTTTKPAGPVGDDKNSNWITVFPESRFILHHADGVYLPDWDDNDHILWISVTW